MEYDVFFSLEGYNLRVNLPLALLFVRRQVGLYTQPSSSYIK
jgi:hypothetical protein